MFEFDLTKEPLSSPELEVVICALKRTRSQQIKYSCISDVLHAFIYIGLYFSGLLGGYAILVAVAISTAAAIAMALIKSQLSIGNKVRIYAVAIFAAAAVFFILSIELAAPLPGTLIAAALAVSIVLVGSTLGRNVKGVMSAIENMKTIRDDEVAEAEIARLCRLYPELQNYRETAARNLRPHLTYGELEAMRRWHNRHQFG